MLFGSVLMSVLLILALEGVLRLVGLGTPDAAHASRLKYQQIYLPILEPGERADGTPVVATADSRLPYQSILAEKPTNGLRVFVFGGSATAGLGFSPNVTFARHLERMLEQAFPDKTIEVVNLGIVALAARQVEVLVTHVCHRYEPDTVIVYSGNNEFLEVHAEKYANANANAFTRLRDVLLQTHLYRLIDRMVRGAPKAPSLAEQDFSQEDLRMTQEQLIQDVEMTAEEIAAVGTGYGETIGRIADVAKATGTPIVLMTVGSNWAWRGREDLQADWMDEYGVGSGQALLDLLADEIEKTSETERWELRFKRAVAAEANGDFDLARREYRRAMNEDPHLRRALDSMADAVREAARSRSVPLLDVIEVLGSSAAHGILGHDEFYDYVHFTPKGAVVVAAGLFEKMREAEILPATAYDAGAYARRRLALEAGLEIDLLGAKEWLGFGFDGSGVHDRNLWKYDKFVSSLDERIASHPNDSRARIYRGNAKAWKIGSADEAAEDYRAALELPGDHGGAAQANLDWLERDRR